MIAYQAPLLGITLGEAQLWRGRCESPAFGESALVAMGTHPGSTSLT